MKTFEWILALRKRHDYDAAAKKEGTNRSGVLLVALTLATYMDANGSGAFPSQVTLAADIGKEKKAVKVAIKVLRSTGWLESERAGFGKSNRYRATIPPSDSEVAQDPTAEAIQVAHDPALGSPTTPYRSRDLSSKAGSPLPPMHEPLSPEDEEWLVSLGESLDPIEQAWASWDAGCGQLAFAVLHFFGGEVSAIAPGWCRRAGKAIESAVEAGWDPQAIFEAAIEKPPRKIDSPEGFALMRLERVARQAPAPDQQRRTA